jgi:hypothetical protein
MANSNLSVAKSTKNDEFYTQWIDIEREIQAYLDFNPDVFKGKTVLCPCDDPEWSNFTKYFALRFKEFGMKKFITTSYALGAKSMALPDWNGKGKVFILDNTREPENGRHFTADEIVPTSLTATAIFAAMK